MPTTLYKLCKLSIWPYMQNFGLHLYLFFSTQHNLTYVYRNIKLPICAQNQKNFHLSLSFNGKVFAGQSNIFFLNKNILFVIFIYLMFPLPSRKRFQQNYAINQKSRFRQPSQGFMSFSPGVSNK